jgi:SAM-dependent methyltransferase
MGVGAGRKPIYALGDSRHELERLVRQAEVFAPFTRQLFEQAGIGPGMRVLDVGCGAGDVSFLAAELVGPTGEVVGADISPSAIDWARNRARDKGIGNVSFAVSDPALMRCEGNFDAVVGRTVLMYYAEPARALGKLTDHVRPCGIIAFQEFDMGYMRSFPPARTFEMMVALMKDVFRASGVHINIGLELNSVFLNAGLAEPSLRIDALIGGVSQFPYDIVAATLHNLLPTIERLKIVSTAVLEIEILEERMRAEAAACQGIALSPALVGAWSRKAA